MHLMPRDAVVFGSGFALRHVGDRWLLDPHE